MTPEEKEAARLERNRIRQRAYRQTEAGKAAFQRWNQSAPAKESTAKYTSRPDIKAKNKERRESPEYKRYLKSPEYKAARHKWNVSERGRAVKQRWNNSEKGKATRLAYLERLHSNMRKSIKSNPAIGEIFTAQLMGDALYSAVFAVVPRYYPRDVRDDIIMEIIVAVLEGRETVASASRKIGSFAPSQYKDHFKTVSLDAVIPGTQNLRLIDTISA